MHLTGACATCASLVHHIESRRHDALRKKNIARHACRAHTGSQPDSLVVSYESDKNINWLHIPDQR
ncbi:hypothetical protein EMIT0111MI5_20541 [Burkholderia sp. IT-111MI5]